LPQRLILFVLLFAAEWIPITHLVHKGRGAGSLLDNSIIMYGSNMSNSNAHNHFPLPALVVGGGAGRLKGGRHLKYPDHTPMSNLLLTLLDKAGVPMDSIGDSTGKMSEL